MYAELAGAAAAAVVAAAATDSWTWARQSLARLLARAPEDEATRELVARTEQARSSSPPDPELAPDLGRDWAARLRELLASRPDLAPDLQALVDEAARRGLSGASGVTHVSQHVTARDEAQQAVQGQGIQNVRFGSRDDR